MNANPTIPVAGLPAEYKECFKCSFRGETGQSACPQCGKTLRSAKNIRVRGIIQLVTGIFLVAMMIGLAVFISMLVARGANDPDTAKKLADQRSMFLMMYALFAVIGLFGLNGIVMGTWQAVTGRRNKALIWVMFILLAVVVIACLGVTFVVS